MQRTKAHRLLSSGLFISWLLPKFALFVLVLLEVSSRSVLVLLPLPLYASLCRYITSSSHHLPLLVTEGERHRQRYLMKKIWRLHCSYYRAYKAYKQPPKWAPAS